MKWILRIIIPLTVANSLSAGTNPVVDHLAKYQPLSGNWFLGFQAGGQQLVTPSWTSVNNGSGYTPPNDQDLYTVGNSALKPLLSLQAGRRWEFSQNWLSSFSLGLQYQHFFSAPIDGQIIEYSLPEFTNYSYQWSTDSNLILANAKLNATHYKGFSPYFSLGVGAVLNHGSYSETAVAGVTPRISPSYSSNSNARAAYTIAAGLDYQFRPELILSAGYQYSSIGSLNSGYGATTWSTHYLNFGSYRSNAFLFGLTYLFEKKASTFYQK